jgi:muconolactone delta-isomerase
MRSSTGGCDVQVLAVVRRRTETFSDDQFASLLEPEAQAIRTLYAQGIVRIIWSREDTLGAVALFEANSVEHVRAIVDGFPLMQAGMLELQMLIPLKGYRGFGPRT